MNLDAYTVRKIAPRLFFAVVGVNLSIYLCVAAVDIASVAGHGIIYMIRAPFDTANALDSSIDQGAANVAAPLFVVGLLAAVVTLKGASGAAISTIFFLLLPVFVLILTTLLTLALRQALVVLLTLISPIAIVLAVLPGTEKYFKQWWDLFLKTLIVYPIIAALFGISDVLTSVSFNASNVGSNTAGAANVINGLIFAFMPLAMIPFVFRFAGGALGGFFGATQAMRSAINRYSMGRLQKNFTEGLTTVRGEGLFSNTRQKQIGTDENGDPIYGPTGLRHRINQGAARLANMDKIRPTRPIASLNTATERAVMKQAQAVRESEEGKILDGFDDEMWAAIHSDGTDKSIDAALRQRAGPRFNYLADGISQTERNKRYRDMVQARNMIKDFNQVGGVRAGRAAAAVSLHGISTSYDTQFKRINPVTNEVMNEPWIEDEHPESQRSDQVYKTSERQMQESIATASGGMRGLGNWITAESIKGAKQAARYDLAASASAVVMYQEAMRSGDQKAIQEMEEYYKKMMVERVTPAQMLQGHPRAAKEMSIAWRDHVDKLADSLDMSAVKGDSLEVMQQKQEELTRALGDVAGIQDVLASAGKESVDYFDKNVLSHKAGKGQRTIESMLESVRSDPIVSRRRHEWRRRAGADDMDARDLGEAEAMERAAQESGNRPDPSQHNPMNPLS
ncbi:MAG TPA: hypothetical protein VFX86_04130 [Candidatus Saccharimonadales bacterium]|nr:hypothetical protein [Candidatus Saccharimonadales bacterium]